MFTAALVAAFFVPATANAQPPEKLHPACERGYTAGEYRPIVHRIYQQDTRVWPRQLYRLLHMRQCAVDRGHLKRMHRMTLNQRRYRINRQLWATRTCGTPACNRRLGEYMITRRYGAEGWNCTYPIIDQESGWDESVWNYGGSGAYGIPQALPAGKMASAGADYMTNPRTQIRWLISYIRDRYGSPCQALAFKRATGWY